MSLLSALALGFVLGVRHATDADHVAAVATIVSRERELKVAAVLGAFWGLGHSVTLLLVGGALVIFRLSVPAHVGLGVEMAVAVMLVVLGTMNVMGAMRRFEFAVLARKRSTLPMVRALVVGVVHGLAGSAALALLVLSTIRDATGALTYLLVFGLGTVVGMMFLTIAMALPMAVASDRFAALNRTMVRATGMLSILFGGYLVYRIGLVDGLFSSHPRWTPQ